MDDCYDKVRFALSDETGEMRFTAFDIVNTPECSQLTETLRRILIDRRLADIDVAEIQGMSCPGNGQCMTTIVRIITEYQERFLRRQRQGKLQMEVPQED